MLIVNFAILKTDRLHLSLSIIVNSIDLFVVDIEDVLIRVKTHAWCACHQRIILRRHFYATFCTDVIAATVTHERIMFHIVAAWLHFIHYYSRNVEKAKNEKFAMKSKWSRNAHHLAPFRILALIEKRHG